MKKVLLLSGLTFVFLIVMSSTIIKSSKKDFINFDKKLFASPYEVTNKEYREFLNFLKLSDNEKYVKCLYDSTQWVKKFPVSYNQPMQENYHSHPAYDNYPVVNITKEASDEFCKWLTEKYNASSKKKYKKIQFRLPTEPEWRKLASPLTGHILPWYGNLPFLSGDEKTALANIKVRDYVTGATNYGFDGAFHSMIVGYYKANNLGLYDVIGNVSEITQGGQLKGGSWDNYLEECTVDKTQNYQLPDPRVGFRVVMEVVEE